MEVSKPHKGSSAIIPKQVGVIEQPKQSIEGWEWRPIQHEEIREEAENG